MGRGFPRGRLARWLAAEDAKVATEILAQDFLREGSSRNMSSGGSRSSAMPVLQFPMKSAVTTASICLEGRATTAVMCSRHCLAA